MTTGPEAGKRRRRQFSGVIRALALAGGTGPRSFGFSSHYSSNSDSDYLSAELTIVGGMFSITHNSSAYRR